MFIELFPNEIDLLSFFESEPIFYNPEDLHYAYKFSDNNDMALVFSFSATGGWIQVNIEFNSREITHYLIENIKEFFIKKDINGEYLSSIVENNDTKTMIEIRVIPIISVKCITLIK
ncbi:hypothetical protein PT286_03535 [Neisseriaceae bacterium ESL0693]|nr:hypothetical protein [Neisseriaceae bacterium ESL0693]